MSAQAFGSWHRVAFQIDAQSFADSRMNLHFQWRQTGAMGAAMTVYIDGLMLLDVTDLAWLDETNFPTDYRPPGGSTVGAITIGGVSFSSGSGSPEGVLTAVVGSVYLRLDGSTSTTLYVKTSGTGNTGWTAK
jgi:hypothetical protein